MKNILKLDARSVPQVLLLGNGILRLSGGCNWSDLLREIEPLPRKEWNLTNVPYAMQPEAICGVNVEAKNRHSNQGSFGRSEEFIKQDFGPFV